MDQVEPALFYTGLVADLYAPLRSSGAPIPAPYIRFVRRSGEPALELGCGDGDPLLDLRARGLDVEGLDASPDMLARCRANAAARGLVVTLHESPMESMELPPPLPVDLPGRGRRSTCWSTTTRRGGPWPASARTSSPTARR